MPGFRRVSEEELLRAWLFRVDRLHLLDPDGKPFDRVVIRHPGAVTVVPVHDDGTVTLVRQYRAAVDALVLEIPAGTRDKDGEEPEATARRELAEEAGLEATRWELLIGTWNTPGVSDQHTLIYLATGLSSIPTRPQGVEEGYMTVETIHLDDVDALVADGSLRDETTVLGLYLARQRLRADGPAAVTRAVAARTPRSSSPGSRSSGDAPRAPWRPTGATSGRTRKTSPATPSTRRRPPTWRRTWRRCAGPTAPRRWPGRSRASGASTASWSKKGCGATTPRSICPPSP